MLARDSRRAILVMALHALPQLSTPAQASPSPASPSSQFNFPTCANGCIGTSGCGLNDPPCMCKAAARGSSFLKAVLTCMYFHCRTELAAPDANFLTPFEDGCTALDRPIPGDSLQQAEAFASSLADGRFRGSTTSAAAAAPSTVSSPPETMSSPPPFSVLTVTPSATVASPAPSSTSVSVESTTETPPASSMSPTSTTEQVVSQTTSAEAPVAESDAATSADAGAASSTATTAEPKYNTIDSNPFATANAAVQDVAAPWIWAGVPLAAIMALG